MSHRHNDQPKSVIHAIAIRNLGMRAAAEFNELGEQWTIKGERGVEWWKSCMRCVVKSHSLAACYIITAVLSVREKEQANGAVWHQGVVMHGFLPCTVCVCVYVWGRGVSILSTVSLGMDISLFTPIFIKVIII